MGQAPQDQWVVEGRQHHMVEKWWYSAIQKNASKGRPQKMGPNPCGNYYVDIGKEPNRITQTIHGST